MTSLMEHLEAYLNEALKSKERFPIDLDQVWEVIGYARKDNAVRALSSFTEG